LVQTQQSGGNWNGYSYWHGPMATAWNINILNATEIQEDVIPEPATVLIWTGVFGLALGAGWWRGRKAA
jgi:hypothetical protein